MAGALVHLEVRGTVATITIGHAEGGATLDSASRTQLLLALSRAASAAEVLAVVLRGGGPDFCAGRDLTEYASRLARDTKQGGLELDVQTEQLVAAIGAVPKPVIAAVHGRCTGEGLALALAADLRVLADDSRLSTATTTIGAQCDAGLRAALDRWVGAARTRELLLSGRTFTAREAVEWGLVAEVAPRSRVHDLALGQAAMVARLPHALLVDAKVMLAGAAAVELERALAPA